MSWIAGLPERIADKISPEPNSGCWIWTGCEVRAGVGYGKAFWCGKQYRAHRLVYEILRGPISDGLTIDHLCRVRCCVNPDHLEPVSIQENIQRGVRYRYFSPDLNPQTHCWRGHPLLGDNLYIKTNGRRRCQACHRISNRKYTRRPEIRERRNRHKRQKRQELRELKAA